ncbi:MAG: SMP-30/gluconolactonase/LRE family protein, partial [Dehalococcoidia bacterium]|nr:SMP-30/gluconolactonase/LRE family protein [Dehalococcoidia bacterium]
MTGPDQFEIFDDDFRQMLGPSPGLTLLADGLTFAEGVCWVPGREMVIVSDIPNNRIVRWEEGPEGPSVSTFRTPSGRSNGL